MFSDTIFLVLILAILHKCGQTISDEEINEMIEVCDLDKNGKIDYKGMW